MSISIDELKQSIVEQLKQGKPISSFDRERAQHVWWNNVQQQFEYIEEDYQLGCSTELQVTPIVGTDMTALQKWICHVRVVDVPSNGEPSIEFWNTVLKQLINTEAVLHIKPVNPCNQPNL